MSFQVNVPPSVVAKLAQTEKEVGGEEEETTKQKREDWKKLKELEEARKAGTAPAMQDEEGKDINPHIPQYIMQAPWYFGATQPTLRHQRPQEEKQRSYDDMNRWYKRGVKEQTVPTKYRKGACENCGSMTHKKKDCLERPRKVGAKFSGSSFAPDEFIQPQLSFDYDGKRDRWNGYDLDEHKRITEEYAKIEEAKRQLKAQRLENPEIIEEEEEKTGRRDSEGEEDEDKYADDVDMPGQKFESKQRITVRNLRIREDTAKYLYNLDPNSAYYDPKTRSMRENPFRNSGKEAQDLTYAGDNFVRFSGDAMNMAKRQIFAWEAYEKGTDVHLQADPTKLHILDKEYKRKKEVYKTNVKESILDKYGGQEHLEAPPKQLLMAQSEDYVEYSRHGTVIKGQEKAKVKSRYEEDVYINNHTSVWGSFWKEGKWGFKCCHSLIKESYCTGEAGITAQEGNVPAITEGVPTSSQTETQPPISLFEQHQEQQKDETKDRKTKKKNKKKNKKRKNRKKRKHKKHDSSNSDSSSSESESSSSESESEDEEVARERRIKKAMKEEEKRVKEVDRIMAMDERKRPYNSMYDAKAPTEEEIEAFRRKRLRADDPMAQFLQNP